MFCAYIVLKGICQSRRRWRPNSDDVIAALRHHLAGAGNLHDDGRCIPGPSPFQLHFSAPVAASKAVSAPCVLPPTCTITRPRSTTGEVATPKSGEPNSLRHCGLPVLASKQESVPPMPKVKIRPSVDHGRRLHTFAVAGAAGFTVYGAA
jgi:hypothetical protein